MAEESNPIPKKSDRWFFIGMIGFIVCMLVFAFGLTYLEQKTSCSEHENVGYKVNFQSSLINPTCFIKTNNSNFVPLERISQIDNYNKLSY